MPEAAARGFGATADLYEARRPTYPEAAIGWLTTALGIQQSSTVVDLGAGTGKLTRRIAAKTLQVFAVEPLAAMCGQFSRSSTCRSFEPSPRRFPFEADRSTPYWSDRPSTGSTLRPR